MAGDAAFIFDACVLIDYWEADPALLRLIAERVAIIHIATPVLAEVDQISRDEAKQLGLSLITPDLQLVDAAVQAATIRLSWQDILCADLAAQAGWICVTNDASLHERCDALSIKSIWGLRPLLIAVQVGAMTARQARHAARAIQATNPLYITDAVIQRFERELS